ncbi:MAG: 2-C-methyl-D-erythritol 4-phosphate cytidylyltransferase [Candidatus Nanopelagicales bacterium]
MTALILVAAGSGQRLAAGVPKALVEVAGDSLIGHCIAAARQVDRIHELVVVAPAAEVDRIAADVQGVTVVAGGATRDASVRAGLLALPEAVEMVLIHDAARPFTPVEVYDRVITALDTGADAVIPALPVADTIKRVADGIVVATVDRCDLVAVQTPQGFRVATLRCAHEQQTDAVTDDAMLVETMGVPVHVVAGSHDAFKITTAFDLAVARAMREV